jgi:arylsulfatase A-like enzyme
MGHPDVKTPNLDAVAEQGMIFSDHFCPYPVCVPSRMSLLSGQWPATHLARSNRSAASIHGPSMPRALGEAGYRTAAVGKMHFKPTYKDYGFDVMLLAEQDGDGRYDDDYHRYLVSQGRIDLLDLMDQRREFRVHAPQEYWDTFGAMPSDLPEEMHSTTWIADRAVETIEDTESPLFMWCGFIKPHHPFDPPKPWHEMYDPDSLAMPEGWIDEPLERDDPAERYFDMTKLDEASLRRVMAYYYATISHMDHHIGRILEAAKAKGPTVIIFTSDHGDLMGYHHLILKAGLPYDPLVRIPLMVAGLEGVEAGSRCGALTQNMDLTHTILEMGGARVPRAMQGRSMMPLLRGEREELREAVFAEIGPMRMARTRQGKLVVGPGDDLPILFDFERDPLEMANAIDDPAAAGLKDDLVARMLGWLQESARPAPHAE